MALSPESTMMVDSYRGQGKMGCAARLAQTEKVVITSSKVCHGSGFVKAVTKQKSKKTQEVMTKIEPDQLNFEPTSKV